jgi:hypothetical protein
MFSSVDAKPHYLYEIFDQEVKKQGITTIILNISKWLGDSKTSESLIKNLESDYKVPNRNTEQKYNLGAIEQLSTRTPTSTTE